MMTRILPVALVLAHVACGGTTEQADLAVPPGGGRGGGVDVAGAPAGGGVEPGPAGGGVGHAGAGFAGAPLANGGSGQCGPAGCYPSSGGSGAAGEPVGGMGGAEPVDTVAGQAGAPLADGGAGGADAEPVDAPPWQVCDTETCGPDELCLHSKHGDQSSPRSCQLFPRPLGGHCDPGKPPGPDSGFADCCKQPGTPVECSRPYWKCSTMDAMNGEPCGWCDGLEGDRWSCGPP